MNQLQVKVGIALTCAACFHFVLIFIREAFRRKIKQGDIVGIKFGDYVVNRKVERLNKDEVFVLNFDSKYLVFVPKDRVYLRSNQGDQYVG